MKKHNLSSRLELDKGTEKKMFWIRKKRYILFKQTHDLSLTKITDEEWLFLERKADLYERFFGVDRCDKIIELYQSAMNNIKLLEKGTSYNYFLVRLNELIEKDCSSKIRTVRYLHDEELEEILGDNAIYNGEQVLLNGVYQQKVIPTIKSRIGEQRFNEINDVINKNKTLKEVGTEIGLTHQGVCNRVGSTLKKIRSSAKTMRFLQEAFESSLQNEETTINTSFVNEKQFKGY